MEKVFRDYERVAYYVAHSMHRQFPYSEKEELINIARYSLIKLIHKYKESIDNSKFIFVSVKNELKQFLMSRTCENNREKEYCELYKHDYSPSPYNLIFDLKNKVGKEAGIIIDIVLKSPDEIKNFDTASVPKLRVSIKKLAKKKGIKNVYKYFREIHNALTERA